MEVESSRTKLRRGAEQTLWQGQKDFPPVAKIRTTGPHEWRAYLKNALLESGQAMRENAGEFWGWEPDWLP